MPTTQQQYHETPSLHGNYQYVTFNSLVNRMEVSAQDPASYLVGIKRSQFIQNLKLALKEISKRTPNSNLAIEVQIPDNLSWVIPEDYVTWRRISLVERDEINQCFVLRELDINRNINIGTGYLQDNNLEILFDTNGEILTADSANAYNHPFKSYKFVQGGSNDMPSVTKYGEFNVDEKRGRIVFNSDLARKIVLIEYVSDGLQATLRDEEITLLKQIEEAVYYDGYYRCIQHRRNDIVPANEKERARREKVTLLHQAKLDLMDFNIKAIRRAMRI